MKAIIMECVGPRCGRNGNRMSTSGMIESVKISGRLSFVFNNVADVLPVMYPSAKWPTANNVCSSS